MRLISIILFCSIASAGPISNLGETARQNYAEAQWPRFFALSYYLRKTAPDHGETQRVRMLEMLALIRHCQWDLAQELGTEARQFATAADRLKIKRLEAATILFSETPNLQSEPIILADETPQQDLWPLKFEEATSLNPLGLRRHMDARCFLLPSGAVVAGTVDATNSSVLDGLALATRAEITDSKTVRSLEEAFRKTDPLKEVEKRVRAAYLLTHARPSLVIAGREAYIDFLATTPTSEIFLGRPAYARVLRLQGDELFKRGKFKDASKVFSDLIGLTEGVQSEYATLKLGWCYLNLNDPQAAFVLWRTAVDSHREFNFLTIYQGLGQAFSESRDQRERNIEFLKSLALSDDQRGAVIAGVRDGLTLLTPSEVRRLGEQIANFEWRHPLAEAVLKGAVPKGCAYMPWINALQTPQISYETHGHFLRSCVNESIAQGVEDREIDGIAKRLQRKGVQRDSLLRFAVFRQRPNEICQEGLGWLSDEVEGERDSAPLDQIESACRLQAQTDPGEVFANLKLATVPLRYLTSRGDRLLFIWTRLLDVAEIRVQTLELIADREGRYAQTLLTRILTERLISAKEVSGAHRLLKLYFSNKSAYPHLWLAFAVEAQENPAFLSTVSETANVLAESTFIQTDPEAAQALVQICDSKKLWDALSLVLDQLPKSFSEKNRKIALLHLYSAVYEGEFTPTREPQNSELRFVLRFATDMRNGRMESALPIVGRTALADDARAISTMHQRFVKTLTRAKAQKDAVYGITVLVKGAKNSMTAISRRTWSHSSLGELANETRRNYCRQAGEALTLYPQTGVNDQNWENAFGRVRDYFGQCTQDKGGAT